MSLNAVSATRLNRHRCRCGRPTLYRRPSDGRLARRDDHDVCPRCWRRLMDRRRAEAQMWRRSNRTGVLDGLGALATPERPEC